LTPTANSKYSTDGQIAVEIKKTKTFPATDQMFKVRLRICKAIFSGCFDTFQIVNVAALTADKRWENKLDNLKFSFPASHTMESSDKYVITIESTMTDFKAKSEKFEILSNILFYF
jgi:hypothetical protein